jgi:alpha,alpha-trehalase
MSEKVKNYISTHWDECIRENREDEGTLLGMPYPYIVPAVGHFDEMYYWDVYYTNLGLIIDGRAALAKSNVDNMLYLIEKYGFVPNGNRTFYLTHSQPPHLLEMVRDIYGYYKDKAWLRDAYAALEKEYEFWMTRRTTIVGLAAYSDESDDETLIRKSYDFEERIGVKINGDRKMLGLHYLAICESGWDINTRFDLDSYNFLPVDLNSLMYAFEKNMAYFSDELSLGFSDKWNERAEKRKELIDKLLDNGEGLLLDYNYVTKKHSKSFSMASLYSLFCGVATEEQAKAVVENLYRLEADFGVLANEKNDVPGSYQWGYPNGWPCNQYVAFMGLDRYGYKEEARRIAQKYIDIVDKVFEETGQLWEKYNVVEGNVNVCDEYKMPAMMGWSAGVYLAAEKYLEEN